MIPFANEAKLIHEVVKEFFARREAMLKARADARLRAAAYFTELAGVLEETSAQLSLRKYPHGQCAQLLAHANGMPAALKDVVDEVNLAGLKSRLVEAHNVERLHAEISGTPPGRLMNKLAKLNETAGILRALAAQLRAA